MDTILTLRRPEGNVQQNIRVLRGISRFTGVIEEQHIELTEAGYVTLGSGADISRQRARTYLLNRAPHTEEEAIPFNDFLGGEAPCGKTTLQEVVIELVTSGAFGRVGRGVKTEPYRYWVPIHSPATREGVAAERISDNNAAEQPGDSSSTEIQPTSSGETVPAERTSQSMAANEPKLDGAKIHSPGTTPISGRKNPRAFTYEI